MTNIMTADARGLWEQYAKAWSPMADEERREILARVLAPDVSYLTPHYSSSAGHDVVVEDMEAIQKQFPGCGFIKLSDSAHHDAALFTWQLVLADGSRTATGWDAVRVADGRISSIITFPNSTLELVIDG